MMKSLLIITAVFESLTGIALIAVPSIVVPLLIGIPYDDDSLHVVSGFAGIALIAIGIACWLFRESGASAVAMVKSVLFYNTAATLMLLYATLGLKMTAIGLWPVTIIHLGMALWCLVVLNKK